MARRVIAANDILEVIYQWHKGQNNSQIAYFLEINRKTVKSIWLGKLGLAGKNLYQMVMKS
ncbi:MAG TPA: hypothetical protein ENJ03_00705 [Candidatus Desulfofervidus auxilii]|uniref:DNA binding HTH domain-containing protein n=1 Tax=Desulfofervidus auxilii TaxID=1621989 RepID=A0A7V1I3D4_DESA2|nr:hypothetical protein [Candidatus Desulfofervidus auxilii]